MRPPCYKHEVDSRRIAQAMGQTYETPEPLQLVFGAPHEVITIGPGGWARCNVPDVGDDASVDLRVLVQVDDRRRFYFSRVVVADDHGVSARTMRDLPLGRMQSALSNPRMADRLVELLMAPPAAGGPDGAPEHIGDFGSRSRRKRSAGPAVLKVPEGRRKPDSFYQDVAVAYVELSGRSKQPAADLAEANGVPVTTVHRWVKEARRRGLMAPGRGQRSTEGTAR